MILILHCICNDMRRKHKRLFGICLLAGCFLFLYGCTDSASPSSDGVSSAVTPTVSGTMQTSEAFIGPPSVGLANIFADHMVLQRGKAVKIWGTCTGADTVTVEFKEQTKIAAVTQGVWSVYLNAMESDAEGGTLIVKADGVSDSVSDVLVGDVWLCSGQSNMEWTVANCSEEQKEKIQQLTGDSKIRLAKIPPDMSYTEETDFEQQIVWKYSLYNNIRYNSAYASVFAARLELELDIPIGIINSSYGGTDIEQWISKETMDSLNLQYGKPLPYNCMIMPLKGMTIKGILWYQGENNVTRSTSYTDLFNAYAAQCRADFEDEQLPIVTTMLDRYYDANLLKWGPFRLEQWAIAQSDPLVEIVCSIDLGDKTTIHPNDKYELGIRAAELTLNRVYGITSLSGQSACATGVTRSGNTLLVSFENVESGLILSSGTTVCSLVVSDANAVQHTVEGTIVGDQLCVSLEGITDPLFVRYAYDMYPEAINFYTKTGLPVAPFSLPIP